MKMYKKLAMAAAIIGAVTGSATASASTLVFDNTFAVSPNAIGKLFNDTFVVPFVSSGAILTLDLTVTPTPGGVLPSDITALSYAITGPGGYAAGGPINVAGTGGTSTTFLPGVLGAGGYNITFTANAGPGGGAFRSLVNVTAVPEVQEYLLMGIGLCAVAALASRRRKVAHPASLMAAA